MSFYVQLPDPDGNTPYRKAVIEARPDPDTQSPFGSLIVSGPAEFAARRGEIQAIGWVETEGPARMLSYEEHQEIVSGLTETAGEVYR